MAHWVFNVPGSFESLVSFLALYKIVERAKSEIPKVARKNVIAPHNARKTLFPGSAHASFLCFKKSAANLKA
jgi:hypothetical protein